MLREAYLAPLLVVSAMTAWGQNAPAGVEDALRGRVTEFFQYSNDGAFRKAYELVAEDSKDFYFQQQKVQLKSCQIDSVKFTENFNRADVQTTCQRTARPGPQFPEIEIKVPVLTTWEIVDGKWYYTHDISKEVLTPFGLKGSDVQAQAGPNGQPQLPDLSPQAVAKAGAAILQQPTGQTSGLDKGEVTLSAGKPSSAQVTFHNGLTGAVQLFASAEKEVPGLTITLDKPTVGPNENAIVKISYEPGGKAPDAFVPVRVVIEPFTHIYRVSVKFENAK